MLDLTLTVSASTLNALHLMVTEPASCVMVLVSDWLLQVSTMLLPSTTMVCEVCPCASSTKTVTPLRLLSSMRQVSAMIPAPQRRLISKRLNTVSKLICSSCGSVNTVQRSVNARCSGLRPSSSTMSSRRSRGS